MLNFYLIVLFLISSVFSNKAQNIKVGVALENCRYFRYLYDGTKYYGSISPPNVGDSIEISVHFAQRTSISENYPLKDLLRLINKKPYNYRMDFPSANEVPRLTKITVNGKDICVSNDNYSGSTTFSVSHNYYRTTRQVKHYQQDKSIFVSQPVTEIVQKTQPKRQVVESTSMKTYSNNPFFQKVTSSSEPEPFKDFNDFYSQFNVFQKSFSEPKTSTQVVQKPQAATNVDASTSPKTYSNNPFFKISTQTPTRAPELNHRQAGSSAPQNGKCGNEGSVMPFIFGGSELSRGQFPWLTAVYHIQDSSLRFLCGGSLVSPRTVVTAGHCVKRSRITENRLIVQLGRYNLEDFSDQSYVTRHIKKIIVHPDYNPDEFSDADLAILQLESSVVYNKYVSPICLWSESLDTKLLEGQTGVVAGWGADGTGRPTTPIPKRVNSNIISNRECRRKSSPNLVSLMSERTFCAGNRDGTGPCAGDSGGGLLIYRDSHWYLRGIVSAGLTKQQTCDLDEFVIFCDVAKHLQWVKRHMVS